MSFKEFWREVGKKWSLVRDREDEKNVCTTIKAMVVRLERGRQALPSLAEEILNLADEEDDDE